jgi:hypothetical protein
MKIEQEQKFQPITITLESKREAEVLWLCIREYTPKDSYEKEFFNVLASWFPREAQL